MSNNKNTFEPEKVTNNGSCVFNGCKGKAIGWIYNIDGSVEGGRMELLNVCSKHEDLFHCDENTRRELFGE